MNEDQNGTQEEEVLKTEVVAKAKRRQHTAQYKLRILRELDEAKGSSAAGAIMRREGLYSSLVSKWREQRKRGYLTSGAQRRGPKSDPAAAELERLQRENQRLREKLERAELIIDVQKNLRNWLVSKHRCRTRRTNAARQRPLGKDRIERRLRRAGGSAQQPVSG
jgi:transposase-like protein